MIITGIGSRETPPEICDLFEELGAEARDRNWIVRSGHAEGADYAFEKGALKRCIAYLPWSGFNKKLPLLGMSRTHDLNDQTLDVVYKFEPFARNLSDGIKRIKSRNVYQVLGENLNSPSDIVICWTSYGEPVGGTALAIKIATKNNIPVLNLGDMNVEKNFEKMLSEITEQVGA